MSVPPAPAITVDGPGGSGKGTICHRLATRLGWHVLDSGALYRLVALAARNKGISLGDAAGLGELAAALDVEFLAGDGETPFRILLDGCSVGDELRTERWAAGASEVGTLAEVGAALLRRQRAFRRPPGLVADGRDMGTVVFPDAMAKFYLTASPEARAERRHKQLMGKGIAVNVAGLLADIRARDARDAGRAASPLKAAHDAVIIDTTGLDVDAVMRRIVDELSGRGLQF